MLSWGLSRHPLFKPYVALAAVCFFWGTTYLGIRMSLETFPPLTLVAVSGFELLAADDEPVAPPLFSSCLSSCLLPR